jgi:hypothetical protein
MKNAEPAWHRQCLARRNGRGRIGLDFSEVRQPGFPAARYVCEVLVRDSKRAAETDPPLANDDVPRSAWSSGTKPVISNCGGVGRGGGGGMRPLVCFAADLLLSRALDLVRSMSRCGVDTASRTIDYAQEEHSRSCRRRKPAFPPGRRL